ncbi:FAD-dependent oxidoreductase [Lentzea sp. NBRC 105346]|uniref:NAD(P)/FAD-dependent oxidoreductase n=1 Tax=Lentzea sp. NBRC 105346 TaxID=3032205 RepID=UPI0024A01F53|nr:FAD-dependent oxidoreductase [Lentzea sp. NBRC 105346]GLZ35120.1 FAD-dependent oxidoreductase [Lentzea sp. NBRC 105346]
MHPDVVVVGAGIIGAACAEALTARGLRVTVLDRGPVASGTSAAGEGNVLVSDKEPGPELDLAVASRERWSVLVHELREETGRDVEWEEKGGLVVATTPRAREPLEEFADRQRRAGVDACEITPEEARELEPHLNPELTAAVHYLDDAQLNPVKATLALLEAAKRRGGTVLPHTEVSTTDGRTTVTSNGTIQSTAVINACGPWADRFGVNVRPRRGVVLVTVPMPDMVRHKVYDADYVGAAASDDAGLQTSGVVESTQAGTILIGSTRQRVGFDERIEPATLKVLAQQAIALFPMLSAVPVMRAYCGFRPYTPDHLPIIGPDPRTPGLWHATGHEGAGIGLAAATGRLIAELITGENPHVDPHPFRVDRPAVPA